MIYAVIFTSLFCNIFVELSSSKNKTKIKLFTFFLLVFFLGLKFQIGVDWYAYEYWYRLIGNDRWTDVRTDIGFKYLLVGANWLGLDYYTFNCLITFFSLSIFFKFWQHRLSLAIIPFVLIFYKGYGALLFDQTRQLITFSISLLAIQYLLQGKKTAYFFSLVVATLFHPSAICLFLYSMIKSIRLKKHTMVIVYVLGVVLGVLHIDLFASMGRAIESHNVDAAGAFGKLVRYMTRDKVSFFTFGMVERFMLFIIYIYMYDKRMYINDKTYRFFYNLGLIYFYLSLFLFNYPTMTARFTSYFFVGVVYIACVYMMRLPKINMAIIVSLYFMFMSTIYFRNIEYLQMLYPYKNYYIDGVFFNERDVNLEKVKDYWAESGLILE